jgi:hypothetical protein
MNALQKTDAECTKIGKHIRTVFEICCHFCSMTHTAELDREAESLTEFITSRHNDGWREITSREFNVVSIACPDCVKMPDKDRGR